MHHPLNYGHLRYFWVVVRAGGVTAAAKRLHVSQPAISSQLKSLESTLGEALFKRKGRTLALTSFGQAAFDYAERIFAMGDELVAMADGNQPSRCKVLVIGVGDTLPKVIVSHLLAPVFALKPGIRVRLQHGSWDRIVGALAAHELQLVLADHPVQPNSDIKVSCTLVAESHIAFYAHQSIAEGLRRGFPKSLQGAELLLPPLNTALRRAVDQWLEEQGIRINCIAEVDDSALTKSLGHLGVGIFPAPATAEPDLVARYGVRRIGKATGLSERIYAIVPPGRRDHPGVSALLNGASSPEWRRTFMQRLERKANS